MRPIDADALKKVIEEKVTFIDGDSLYKIIALIDNAPSVEIATKLQPNCNQIATKLQQTKGEWIEHYSKEMSEKGYFLCSRCKCGFQRFERGIRHSDLPWIDGQKYELHCIDNYCPNCGAKMKGGAE